MSVLSRTYLTKSSSFLNSVPYVNILDDKDRSLLKAGLASETPTNGINDCRYNMHRY